MPHAEDSHMLWLVVVFYYQYLLKTLGELTILVVTYQPPSAYVACHHDTPHGNLNSSIYDWLEKMP